MKPLFQAIRGVQPTPRDYPPLEQKLELVCGACGAKGKYAVGRVFLNPGAAPEQGIDEAVCFSGYFRCRKCAAGGPWELTPRTVGLLTLLMTEARANPQQARIRVAEMRLFDGTPVRNSVEAETRLKRLIAANPTDYFLWSRLGNMYAVAEQEELAAGAFRKAVELNPFDVESQHSLGEYYRDKDADKSAEHFHRTLQFAGKAPEKTRAKPALLHSLVRHALETLLDLHRESKARIEFLPPLDPEGPLPGFEDCKDPVIVLRNFDLSSDQGWEELAQIYLRGSFGARPPVAKAPAASRRKQGSQPGPAFGGYALPTQQPNPRIGRNDPCPCGSGRKYKKCCGAD